MRDYAGDDPARARRRGRRPAFRDEAAYELTLRDVGAEHPRTAYYAMLYAQALRAAGETARADVLRRQYRAKLEAAYPAASAYRRVP